MLKTKGEKYFLLKEMEYGTFPRESLKIMNLYLNVLKERLRRSVELINLLLKKKDVKPTIPISKMELII